MSFKISEKEFADHYDVNADGEVDASERQEAHEVFGRADQLNESNKDDPADGPDGWITQKDLEKVVQAPPERRQEILAPLARGLVAGQHHVARTGTSSTYSVRSEQALTSELLAPYAQSVPTRWVEKMLKDVAKSSLSSSMSLAPDKIHLKLETRLEKPTTPEQKQFLAQFGPNARIAHTVVQIEADTRAQQDGDLHGRAKGEMEIILDYPVPGLDGNWEILKDRLAALWGTLREEVTSGTHTAITEQLPGTRFQKRISVGLAGSVGVSNLVQDDPGLAPEPSGLAAIKDNVELEVTTDWHLVPSENGEEKKMVRVTTDERQVGRLQAGVGAFGYLARVDTESTIQLIHEVDLDPQDDQDATAIENLIGFGSLVWPSSLDHDVVSKRESGTQTLVLEDAVTTSAQLGIEDGTIPVSHIGGSVSESETHRRRYSVQLPDKEGRVFAGPNGVATQLVESLRNDLFHPTQNGAPGLVIKKSLDGDDARTLRVTAQAERQIIPGLLKVCAAAQFGTTVTDHHCVSVEAEYDETDPTRIRQLTLWKVDVDRVANEFFAEIKLAPSDDARDAIAAALHEYFGTGKLPWKLNSQGANEIRIQLRIFLRKHGLSARFTKANEKFDMEAIRFEDLDLNQPEQLHAAMCLINDLDPTEATRLDLPYQHLTEHQEKGSTETNLHLLLWDVIRSQTLSTRESKVTFSLGPGKEDVTFFRHAGGLDKVGQTHGPLVDDTDREIQATAWSIHHDGRYESLISASFRRKDDELSVNERMRFERFARLTGMSIKSREGKETNGEVRIEGAITHRGNLALLDKTPQEAQQVRMLMAAYMKLGDPTRDLEINPATLEELLPPSELPLPEFPMPIGQLGLDLLVRESGNPPEFAVQLDELPNLDDKTFADIYPNRGVVPLSSARAFIATFVSPVTGEGSAISPYDAIVMGLTSAREPGQRLQANLDRAKEILRAKEPYFASMEDAVLDELLYRTTAGLLLYRYRGTRVYMGSDRGHWQQESHDLARVYAALCEARTGNQRDIEKDQWIVAQGHSARNVFEDPVVKASKELWKLGPEQMTEYLSNLTTKIFPQQVKEADRDPEESLAFWAWLAHLANGNCTARLSAGNKDDPEAYYLEAEFGPSEYARIMDSRDDQREFQEMLRSAGHDSDLLETP